MSAPTSLMSMEPCVVIAVRAITALAHPSDLRSDLRSDLQSRFCIPPFSKTLVMTLRLHP